jgi:sugar/nucleoside kinase (ribokinase family)
MLDESAFADVALGVVGSICRDVIAGPLSPGNHLFQDGETPTTAITETLGGGGANAAVIAAKLGGRVTIAGKVGADLLGERLVTAMSAAGVQSFLCRDPSVSTGSSVALTYIGGQRHFICNQPNNTSLSLADLDSKMLPPAGGHLLRADVWFAEPMLQRGNEQLLANAKAKGISTSLDINWDPQWNVASDFEISKRIASVRAVLPFVDLVHGNVQELNRFAQSDDLAVTLGRLTEWGAGAVVIHLGEQGAGYFCGGDLVTEPCAPVSRHVNSAGTGDLLSVCMMLLHHRTDVPIAEKLRLANRIVGEFIEGRRNLRAQL